MINKTEITDMIELAECGLIFHLITLAGNEAAEDAAVLPDDSIRQKYANLLDAANSAQTAHEATRKRALQYVAAMSMEEIIELLERNRIKGNADIAMDLSIAAKKEVAR